MSTILKALRRLEQDSGGHTTPAGRPADTLPATDPRAADELRDRILAEESAAQAGAAAHSQSDRTKRIVIVATAASLILALSVGAYTAYRTSTRADSDPTAIVVTETASLDSAPKAEDPRTGKALAGVVGVVSLQPTSEQAASLSNSATAGRHSRPETLAGNEASKIPAEEALPESETGSQSSTVSAPVPVPLPMPADAITPSPRPAVVSRSATTPPPSRSVATKSVAPSSPPPPKVADEMALAAVTPTPATLATSSRGTVATPETPLDGTLAGTPVEPVAETRQPPNRPKPTSAAPNPPPVVSAPERRSVPKTKSAESRPARTESRPLRASPPSRESRAYPEPSQVERLDRRGLPDLTVLRTAWHPDPDRRSARIRLEATDEILTLREGDAVGGLVIQQISPSTVLFKAGDVEVRRRVGQPGSGG